MCVQPGLLGAGAELMAGTVQRGFRDGPWERNLDFMILILKQMKIKILKPDKVLCLIVLFILIISRRRDKKESERMWHPKREDLPRHGRYVLKALNNGTTNFFVT